MIETYKIMTGKYDIEIVPSVLSWGLLFLSNERSQLEIQKNRTKYDLCKYFFANRIVNIWNSLPSYVVSAETVNCFKTRLDRFWLNQDITYKFSF